MNEKIPGVAFIDNGEPNHEHFYDPVEPEDVKEGYSEWTIWGGEWVIEKIPGRKMVTYLYDPETREYEYPAQPGN